MHSGISEGRHINSYLIELVRLLVARQQSPRQVLAGTGLGWEAVLHGSQSVQPKQFSQAINNALDLCPEPGLGLHFGRRLNVNTHGILGYALMSSPNLSSVLDTWIKYHRVAHQSLALTTSEVDDTLVISLDICGKPEQQRIFFVETLIACVLDICEFLVAERLPGVVVNLDYAAPAASALYQEMLGLVPCFDSAHSELVIPQPLGQMRVLSADEFSANLYQRQCAEMLKSIDESRGFVKQVRAVLLESHGNFPSISEVAARFHVSERTLRRRLQKEGTTFQSLIDGERFNIAQKYLKATQLSTADIAELVGYSDPSNFRRAFCQWAGGVSPAKYRRSQLNA